MNEQFNKSPQDNNEQSDMLYGEMIESSFLKAKGLMELYQKELDKQIDDKDQDEVLQDLYEEVKNLGIFDQEVKFSAKVRPIYVDELGSVDDLVDEGSDESAMGEDEYGEFAYLTGASGFSIIGSTSIDTEVGERIGFVIEDNFGNEYGILPEDIYRLEEVDQSDEAIIKEVEAFYPKAAKELSDLRACNSSEEQIELLRDSSIALESRELHSSPNDVARQLGRYATIMANLDNASHNLVFNGDFSILGGYGEFEDMYTEDEVTLTPHLRSINMQYDTEGDDHFFIPELDMIVGLPSKDDGFTSLRVPVENIVDIKSNRLQNLDFIFGSEVGRIQKEDEFMANGVDYSDNEPAYEYTEEDQTDSEKEDINSLRRRFAEARAELEDLQTGMDDLVSNIRQFSNRWFDNISHKMDEVTKIKDDTLRLGNMAEGHIWSYTGEGIVMDDTVGDTDGKPVFGRIDGMVRGYYMAPRFDEVNHPNKVSLDFYLRMQQPTSIESNSSSFFNIGRNYNVPLKESVTHTQSEGLINQRFMQESPSHVVLDSIKKRDMIVDVAKDMFGNNSDLHQAVANFAEAINLSLLPEEDEEYLYKMPIQDMQQALYDNPKASDFAKLMTEAITYGTSQNVYLYGNLQTGEQYEGSAKLAGIEVVDEKVGPVLHLIVDDEPLDMELFRLKSLSIGRASA